MNREIRFRAKRKDWRKLPKEERWVEGDLIQNIFGGMKRMWITSESYDKERLRSVHKHITEWRGIEIDSDTICQYTGLNDKNGKKIWENDIVELPDEVGCFVCEWEEDTARFVMNGDGLTVDFDNYWGYQTEVAGNIFDNPGVLEVE